MHLHLGFRGGGLPEGLGIHYSVVLDDFYDIEAEQNMCERSRRRHGHHFDPNAVT